jgi:ribose-phosphate pyrophosphokinase
MTTENENCSDHKLLLFGCNSNLPLAEKIAQIRGASLAEAQVGRFSDGEISVKIDCSVRGADVFVIQSISHPVNDNLMELLILIDALRRASAWRITAVIPYYGYARQDRKAKARDPITAKLVANLITTAGADRILTMDLHSPQIQGFFDIPLDHLSGAHILAPLFSARFKEQLGEFIVISPDVGSVARARLFAFALKLPLAIVDKRRQQANQSEVMNVIGDVAGKRAIILDDMVDTGGSLVHAADALISRGALEVYACATHGVLSGGARKRIEDSSLKELILLDTIRPPASEKDCEKGAESSGKIKYLSCAEVFAEAIYRIAKDQPVSPLFN